MRNIQNNSLVMAVVTTVAAIATIGVLVPSPSLTGYQSASAQGDNVYVENFEGELPKLGQGQLTEEDLREVIADTLEAQAGSLEESGLTQPGTALRDLAERIGGEGEVCICPPPPGNPE